MKKDKPKLTKERIRKYVESVAEDMFQKLTQNVLDKRVNDYMEGIDDELKDIIKKHIRSQIKVEAIKNAFDEYVNNQYFDKKNIYLKKLNDINWALEQVE
jgi:hypothetical protein